MEHPRTPLLPTTRLQRLAPTHRATISNAHHLPHQRHRARDSTSLHYQEDPRLRIRCSDEPASHRDATADEVDQGETGPE